MQILTNIVMCRDLFEKAVCFLEIFVLFLFQVEKRETWVEESSMILDKTQKILKKNMRRTKNTARNHHFFS